MAKFGFLFVLVGLISFLSRGQELNCKVLVNSDRVQTTEKRVFDDMEIAFAQFLNERRWTNDVFQPEEKINCNILITIESQNSITSFNATVQIQSARPIFDTNYETILFNFADRDWQFEYTESKPLFFNENAFINNLTSMLAYYAYIILGLDYDSFSKLDGTPYVQKAWNVVTNAQQSGRPGWDQLQSNRNRYWLAENMLNPQMLPVRESVYTVHRQGLDIFLTDPDKSRKNILEVLKEIQKVNRVIPNSVLIITFFDAKRTELINIFTEGDINVRRQAYDILSELDPARTDSYRKIINN